MTMNNDVSIGRSWELSVTGQDSAMWRMLADTRCYHYAHLTRMHSCGNVYTVYCAHPAYQTCYHILQTCKPLFVARPRRSRARCLSPYQLMVLLFIFHGKFSVCIITRVVHQSWASIMKIPAENNTPTYARPANRGDNIR